MPLDEMYTRGEVESAMRIAYATALRDVLMTIQGSNLTEEQATAVRDLVFTRANLAKTIRTIKPLIAAMHPHVW